MRVVEIDQAVREVREHCATLDHSPRVVTSGNFATPVTVLGPVLAELPEARLHALNAQRDLPVHDGIVPETTFVGPEKCTYTIVCGARSAAKYSARHRVVDRVEIEQVMPSRSLPR